MDAFPGLVAEIDRLPELADRHDPLAGTVGQLSYYGRCRCSPTCNNILTAPAGSAGTYMIQLERDGIDAIWLSLNGARTAIDDMDVLDQKQLDLQVPSNATADEPKGLLSSNRKIVPERDRCRLGRIDGSSTRADAPTADYRWLELRMTKSDHVITRLMFKAAPDQTAEITFEPVGTAFRLGPEGYIFLQLPESAVALLAVVVWPNGVGVWVPYPGDYVILNSEGAELDRL